MARHSGRLTYANVMSTVAVFAALGGGALAASSVVGSGGAINGCVKKKTGVVRVVKPGVKCRRHREVALKWNRRGPRGATGARGAAGARGARGPAGANVAVTEKCPTGM